MKEAEHYDLTDVWLFDQEVGKHMFERREDGRIISMTSIEGIVGAATGNANRTNGAR